MKGRKFYLFSLSFFLNSHEKSICGPCALVDKYMNSIKDERTSLLEKVDLEDFSDTPIPQENLDLASKYGVTATPVLIITDH